MAWADEVREAVGRAIEIAGPAVVGVGRGRRGGTGTVVADGVVLAVGPWAPGDEVPVTAAADRAGTGRVLAVDGHLVALSVDDLPLGSPPAWAGGPAGVGTPVIALANPGGEGLRAGLGVVSGETRTPRGAAALEHSALLPRGGRGGPLLGADGALVGVNALRRPGGLILALAADADLRARVDALVRGESAPARPRLGVVLTPPPLARRLRAAVGLPERAGALIRDVVPGGPAARAGLSAGDLVVAADRRPVSGPRDLRRALVSVPATAPLALTVVRGVEEREVAVALEAS